MTKSDTLALFGGEKKWNADDWTASDDRVRGGSSQSYLDIKDNLARFHGTLDTKTLGGAGFASQRTVGDDWTWDLSEYKGILLFIAKGDKKRYTVILKDQLLPPDPDTGREQSTISYEVDFELPPQTEPGETEDRRVFVPFSSLNATFRGRLQKDARPINLAKVRRFSIMNRSFFAAQEGDFSLTLKSITALTKIPEKVPTAGQLVDLNRLEKGEAGAAAAEASRPQHGLRPWRWQDTLALGALVMLVTCWLLL